MENQGDPPILGLRRPNSMKLAGIVLIVLGALALAYQGIRYTSREKLIDIGPLKVTATEKKTIPLPPIVGGVAIVAGIALILVERRKK
jgi:drug/metabolite transporter (DMT)-like permease